MTAALTPFTFEGQEIRVRVEGDEIVFVAADVAPILGYERTDSMTRYLDADEKGSSIWRTLGGEQRMSHVTEAGLYAAIMRSTSPESKPFRRWVTHEVLPTIRRTGSYGQPAAAQLTRADLARMVLEAEAERVQAVERAEAAETLAAEREIPARAWDHLASAEGDYSVGDAAKVLASRAGVTTGQNRLFAHLHDRGWTYRREGVWHARQEAIERGYLAHKMRAPRYHPVTGELVACEPQVRVTGKGLERLYADLTSQADQAAADRHLEVVS